MRIFVNNATAEEVSEDVIRSRFSTRGLSNPLTDSDAASVGYGPLTLVAPVYDPNTQSATRGANAQVAGVWTQQWIVTSLPAATAAANIAAALLAAQTAQIASVTASYTTAMGADIAYMATVFQADPQTQALLAQVLAGSGGTLPTGFTWYDKTNVPIAMTFAQLQGFAGAILARNQPLFVKLQGYKATIRAATTISAVQSVLWV